MNNENNKPITADQRGQDQSLPLASDGRENRITAEVTGQKGLPELRKRASYDKRDLIRCTARGRGIGKGGRCYRVARNEVVRNDRHIGYTCAHHENAACFRDAVVSDAPPPTRTRVSSYGDRDQHVSVDERAPARAEEKRARRAAQYKASLKHAERT